MEHGWGLEDNRGGHVLPNKVKEANLVNKGGTEKGKEHNLARDLHSSHGSNSVQGKWVWNGNK